MYTQTDRSFRFDTCLGRDKALLEGFEGTEALSKPFRFLVQFLTESRIDMVGLLGTQATLGVQSEFTDSPVYFNGRIWSVRQRSDAVHGLFAYEAELTPALQLLELHRSCLIFHKSDVKTMVSKVLDSHGVKNYRFDLQSSLPTREYCVQYRETDLNFVMRLLEEEGIYYFFQHSEDKHELILSDRKTGLPTCPSGQTATYHPVQGGLGLTSPIFSFESRNRMRSGGVELNDYNYETPKVSLSANLDSNANGLLYEYPGWYGTKSDGEHYARIRLEEEEVQDPELSGRSSCSGFRTGHAFQMNGHPYRDWNQQSY